VSARRRSARGAARRDWRARWFPAAATASLEILEQVVEAVEHRIGAGGDAVFPAWVGIAAMHVKTRPPPRPPFQRLGEHPVDLARRGFGHSVAGMLGAQERAVEPIRPRPDLARDETVGAAQQVQVIVVEDMRFALEIELRQGQRPAFDPASVVAHQRLVIAFVGDPDMAEIRSSSLRRGILQDRRQGLSRQAPPLAAQMRRDPLGQLPPEAEATLKLHVAVEQQPLTLPREGETVLEPFGRSARRRSSRPR
jgi:hypothetical protein